MSGHPNNLLQTTILHHFLMEVVKLKTTLKNPAGRSPNGRLFHFISLIFLVQSGTCLPGLG
jgi:hypothetical protein